ncbi:MAG: acyltransferase [Lachnospiraceae bacterium]|nr:acyltransferase [Lachnospiraceae bacterium]
METKTKSGYYATIDGLRAFAAIGIAMMHILVNGGYEVGGFVFDKLIPSFTELVYLFMIISAFSMCCGYYEKIISNKITMGEFYSKRFAKIWPFFAFLSVLDVILSPGKEALYELFANLTLCFGLLPNANITVIGVGWFIGVAFVFYFVFPFFCYLLSDKRRAWLAFGIALVYNFLCRIYFFDQHHVAGSFAPRTSFMYCAVFFLAGGLIYLYREQLGRIAQKCQWLLLLLCGASIVAYYVIGNDVVIMLVMFSMVLICAIGAKHKKILQNRVSHFLSGISMEIYLCHMVMFRVMEKLHLTQLFTSDLLSYVVTVLETIICAICFAVGFGFGMKKLKMVVKGFGRNQTNL